MIKSTIPRQWVEFVSNSALPLQQSIGYFRKICRWGQSRLVLELSRSIMFDNLWIYIVAISRPINQLDHHPNSTHGSSVFNVSGPFMWSGPRRLESTMSRTIGLLKSNAFIGAQLVLMHTHARDQLHILRSTQN
jgi:hypothetical protein